MDARLYLHAGSSPHFNMGFDEWMLAQVSLAPKALYFRLYTWQPGTITFGYNQRQTSALDFAKVGETPVIRRITGGRAVYHDESEVTYSVAFNARNPLVPQLGGTTAQSSAVIAEVLSEFLAEIGVSADWVRVSARENSRPDFFHKAACFASHAKFELSSSGAKIVASARRDWRNGVLQHGSIKVRGYVAHPALFSQPTGVSGLESLAPPVLNDLAERLHNAVEIRLGVTLVRCAESDTTSSQLSRAVAQVVSNPLGKREIIAQ